MIKRRFYKLEHGDKDSGSDSSCFSSDSDPESEESGDEDAVAEVSEDDDSASEGEGGSESPAGDDDADVGDGDNDDDDSDAEDYRRRLEMESMNRRPNFDEPPEEKEENYILGCMIQCKSVYKCRYCPNTICLNETTMQAHVSSKKHARLERLMKEEELETDDEELVDHPETPSQEKQVKGNRRSQRQGKRSRKLRTVNDEEVNNPEMPSEEKQIKGNRKARRQGMRSQKQEKGSSTTQGENADAIPKSRKKRRQTKD